NLYVGMIITESPGMLNPPFPYTRLERTGRAGTIIGGPSSCFNENAADILTRAGFPARIAAQES
ncbi:MAG: hypothetical protein RBT84_17495, partial [FCB group bacterium]|nr:hypothetical protein [FCB group bacterium]